MAEVDAFADDRSFTGRLARFWSLGLPAWLDYWFPQVAKAMADGAWTAAWKAVAAYAPIVAFLVGLLCRLIWADIYVAYSQSLVFMALIVAAALLSGPLGAMMLLGYVVEDLAVGNRVDALGGRFLILDPNTPISSPIQGVLGGKLVSYILLSIPAITIPLMVRQLAPSIKLHNITDPNTRLLALAALQGAISGVLVYLWAQSLVVLIRPLFTWAGAEPVTSAIAPVQNQWIVLVGVAFMAAAARVILERKLVPGARQAALVELLKRQRWTGEGKGVLERVPELVRVAVPPVIIAMVLSGTYDSWADAILVALLTGALGVWRARLIRLIPMPVGWALAIRRIPALVRLLAAPVIGYLLSTALLTPLWSYTSGLRPVLLGALLTLLVFYLLFPPLPVVTGQAQGQGTAPTGRSIR